MIEVSPGERDIRVGSISDSLNGNFSDFLNCLLLTVAFPRKVR